MKKIKFLSLLIVCLGILSAVSTVRAQVDSPNDEPQQNFNQNRPANILRQLNLSREQIQQIRRINMERKPLMQEAQLRLRTANRNLDQAIYADIPNEEEIKTLTKEVQLAQAEVIKIRTMTEFQIRKVLNPEQLQKFREFRERLMQRLENQKNENNPNFRQQNQPQQLNNQQPNQPQF